MLWAARCVEPKIYFGVMQGDSTFERLLGDEINQTDGQKDGCEAEELREDDRQDGS